MQCERKIVRKRYECREKPSYLNISHGQYGSREPSNSQLQCYSGAELSDAPCAGCPIGAAVADDSVALDCCTDCSPGAPLRLIDITVDSTVFAVASGCVATASVGVLSMVLLAELNSSEGTRGGRNVMLTFLDVVPPGDCIGLVSTS